MADYAAEIAASGSLPPEAAREKAERDTARTLSAGVNTPGQGLATDRTCISGLR
jgi:hypothetical protein